jgi:hypothetical protein
MMPALAVVGTLALLAVLLAACGESSFTYAGVWADEENEIPQLLIEPGGSAWTVRDRLGQTFTYEANDDGLVCTSAAPVTLTPSGSELIMKGPDSSGGYELTLVRLDKTPSPWPSAE